MRTLLLGLLALSFAIAAPSQTGLTGWNRDGQTWLVWNDNLTFTGTESVSIYRSSAPITTLSELQAAERIGRLYPQDWRAGRLQASHPGATWTVPDAGGAPRVLLPNEGLFVYTPHAAGSEWFAVVKTEQLATGPFTATGPIVQTLAPIVPHRQRVGVDAGHPYAIHACWVDGRDDPDSGLAGFPVMGSASCCGIAFVFAVFEPVAGLPAAPMPAVVFLHGGGGSYWTYRPSRSAAVRIDLHLGNGLYVTPDESVYLNAGGNVMNAGTRWFGTCVDFDRFVDVATLPAAGTVVVDFAQRRLAWLLDWLQQARGVDARRTAMAGLSMGGRGTHLFLRTRPERLAAALAFVMPVTWNDGTGTALFGTAAQNLPTNLPGAPGAADVFDPTVSLSPLPRPFARYVDGTTDAEAPWDGKPPVHVALDAQRVGAAIYWDGRGHTASSPTGWIGQFFTGSPKHGVDYLTRYRADQSFPAFHDIDHDLATGGQQPHPGDPVLPANGDPHGTWGGWFEWDPASIVDSATTWSGRLWLETAAAWPADNAPLTQARASVTLRRTQAFQAAPHEVLWVTLQRATAPFPVFVARAVQAGADGAVTIADLPFGATQVVLTVARVAAGGALVAYGDATAGCNGVPGIAGNLAPQLGAAGFVVVHGNAPPNGLGVALFGSAPAQAPVLGIELLVELLAPPAILLPAIADAGGNSGLPVPIPNDPGLLGSQWYSQVAWIDACAPAGFAASRGLAIVVQP